MAKKHSMMWSLNKIIADNVFKGARKHAKNKDVGKNTRARRAQSIRQSFIQLYQLGYKIKDPANLCEKHVQALVHKWVDDGLAASTIQVRVSSLRTFASWIGKPGMVKSAEFYVDDPAKVRRSTVATKDKTWSGNNVVPLEKIKEIFDYDKNVGVQLLLELTFGLRSQESWLLRPHLAHDEGWLRITRGTKGGKERSVEIKEEFEFEVITLAKEVSGERGASMIPARYTVSQWKDRYYRILRKFNIGRRSGVVAHGLRHEYINQKYHDITSAWMSIKGGDATQVTEVLDEAAREVVAIYSGHCRTGIVGAYGGSKFRFKG